MSTKEAFYWLWGIFLTLLNLVQLILISVYGVVELREPNVILLNIEIIMVTTILIFYFVKKRD